MKTDTLPETESTTISVSIAETLRCAILAGDYAPGERMIETHLSERLNVSRTPIRAAFQALAGEGLLIYTPNKGYYVREYSLEDIVQAYEIRGALEGLAARRAAQTRMTREQMEAAEAALLAGDQLIDKGKLSQEDRSRYGVMNKTFHDIIHNAGSSSMIRDMLRISEQIAPSSHHNVIAFELRDVRRRHDDHHRIYEAILTRDSGRAEILMRDHVESVKLSLIRTLHSKPAAR